MHIFAGLNRIWDQKLFYRIDEWSIEFGHHGIDGADVHDHPPLPVPFRRH